MPCREQNQKSQLGWDDFPADPGCFQREFRTSSANSSLKHTNIDERTTAGFPNPPSTPSPGVSQEFKNQIIVSLLPTIPEPLSIPGFPQAGFPWDGFYFLPTSPFVCLGLEFGV